MSSGPENNYVAAVHRCLPPVEKFYRMKNHNVYNGGIADCWYSGVLDLWVEWKYISLAKRNETMIDLVGGKKPAISMLQQDWIKDRTKEGRAVWVAVGTNEGCLIYYDTSWDQPISTGAARSRLVTKHQAAGQILRACKVR